MTRPKMQGISPFFIVSNVDQSVAFYRDRLGFETRFQEPDRNPFFAIIGRDRSATLRQIRQRCVATAGPQASSLHEVGRLCRKCQSKRTVDRLNPQPA